MNRILPFSVQSQERPSSICVRVRHRNPSGSARERVAAELLLVGGGAGGHKQVEVVDVASRSPVFARLRGLVDHVDGLARPVFPRRGVVRRSRVPELSDGLLPADDHARAGVDEVGERGAALPRRDDVHPHVRDREKLVGSADRAQAAAAAADEILEEDALDRLLGAEMEQRAPVRCEDGHVL